MAILLLSGKEDYYNLSHLKSHPESMTFLQCSNNLTILHTESNVKGTIGFGMGLCSSMRRNTARGKFNIQIKVTKIKMFSNPDFGVLG